MPTELTRSLDRAQLRCIFQHELAHVSGGDIAGNWLVTLAVAIHWFNPFVWLMARSIAQAREMACDRAVLAQRNDPQVYGETIVRVAESLSRPQIVAGVAAIVESRNALRERIKMLTQKQGRNAWLAASATALVLGALFLSSSVKAVIAKPVTVPGLPGAGISLVDALGKADIMVVGQVVGVKYEGTDAMTDRYRVKINVTRYLNPTFWFGTVPAPPPPPIEGEVRVTNPAFLGNVISGSDVIPAVQEKIPEDGQNYVFFISTDKKAKSNLIFKMLPGSLDMPNVILEFPEKPATLEDSLAELPPNIVVGRFKKFKPSGEFSRLDGTKMTWIEEYKTVIDVKKTVRGDVSPGLIEGDFSYRGSGNLDAGIGPRPAPPDLSKDYIFYLSAGGPSLDVEENITDPNYIFYLSPGRPSKTVYGIGQILPTDPLALTQAPVAEQRPSLLLPGSGLSLDAAESDALTISVGRVTAVGAYSYFPNRWMNVEILKTLRGKAVKGQGIVQFGYPLNVGRESPPKVGSEYVIFCSNNGAVLKIAPADALSALPVPMGQSPRH